MVTWHFVARALRVRHRRLRHEPPADQEDRRVNKG